MKRRYRTPLVILGGLALFLLALHLALPSLVRDYLNDRLATMGDYRGQLDRVELAWWRGAYRIEGLKIVKQEGRIPVPFLEAPGIDLAVSWHALWHERTVVARAVFEQPQLNFVDGDSREDSQSGEGVDWREQLERLLPITLNEVRIEDGRLAFRNFEADPPVNLQATAVNATLHNLTNVGGAGQGRAARLEATAQVLGQAPLETSARFDPFDEWRDFEWRLRITGIELRRLNAFSRAYGRFDFNAGRGDLVLEVEADDFRLDGYVKPLLKDVDVFDWQQDVEKEEKGFLRGLWEALVGGGQTALKNQRKDQFATRIELSGTLEQQDISPLQAFVAILRNAFVQAFTPRFERALEEERD
ncbi:DUF748 domain-containing protein [Azotobacter salinestris]|uniref:DUF748 domain-containing protein n=1 Tax=Azotobacter salinestris TaxID=69964 RepID=UPI001266C022|nr:DUF748 domain-containing protein [Azotobacter salinestris]